MDLHEKIRSLPRTPGVYLYKNAEDEVIYVGKAKNLRARVGSYLLESSQANHKTGTLMREAVDVDYIQVANEHEALALENNLIKQRKPRFNILLRDDKTYPYVKLTLKDRHPKIFVTRKLRKDGSQYYGPYFPGNLAYRVVDLIHRSFLIPSCKVDLERYHQRPCLEYYIKRCLAPCVESLVSREAYRDAVKDVQLFLDGRENELEDRLKTRMAQAAMNEQFELAAKLRDQLVTLHQLEQKQRIASAEEEDADVFGFHFDQEMLAVNQFHMRAGKIVDKRDFFWEDLPEIAYEPEIPEESLEVEQKSSAGVPTQEGPSLRPPGFSPASFFSSFLKQLYVDQPYVPRTILVPVEFSDRETLASFLGERTGRKVEILVPQRGEKRSLVDLVCQNAKQNYDQRFRTLQPSKDAVAAALQDALGLADLPQRIECFDISHIQGAESVASMVVWEGGEMKKALYRKFKIRSVTGVDDLASMREVIVRRYKRLQGAGEAFPSRILIDGGLGQLHAAYAALESIGVTLQPLASIAKREEVVYVFGQEEDPVVLDRRSPVLHLIQMIRDEAHRFAIRYHRQRREIRDRDSELLAIPGVGPRTRQRLLEHFGSLRGIRAAGPDALTAVVNSSTAQKIRQYFQAEREAAIGGAAPQALRILQ